MASVEKFTETAVVNQLRHIERTIENPSNKDIDSTKTEKNKSLIERDLSSYDYFKKRKSELYCYNRKDVNVMAGWVITLPSNVPLERSEEFFQEVHNFLCERYGTINCIQSIVHYDETTPHLHYYFIPTVKDNKHSQGEKICCNSVIDRYELRNFHPQLQRYIKNKGIDANILTGITAKQGGNRTVRDMKKERQYQIERTNTMEMRWLR